MAIRDLALHGPATGGRLDVIPAATAKTLTGLLIERARRTPDAPAYLHFDDIEGRWCETSWGEAAASVGRWQTALGRLGLEPGERVAMMLRNCRAWVWLDLAAMGLGLVTVPLYPNDRPQSVRHCLEDSGARLLLLESATQFAELAPIAATLDRLDALLVLDADGPLRHGAIAVADWLPAAADTPIDRLGDGDRLATIVYTSGTTGPPKGVMHTHRGLLWNAQASLEHLPVFPSDRFLSFLPLSHTFERTAGYYVAMMAGASVAHARSIPQLAEDLLAVRPTAIIAVPRIFERVRARIREKLAGGPPPARWLFAAALAVGWRAFCRGQGRAPWSPMLLAHPLLDRLVARKVRARLGGRLRVAVCGGAPLSPEVARFFLGLGVPLIHGYGLTEAGPVVSGNSLIDNLPESVGRPLPGVEVQIGPSQELWVRSPAVMQGYWGDPQASAAAVDSAGWLHTGDQARLAAERIFLTGRLKEIIVLSTGEKVPPGDMELAIGQDPLFSQVLVVGESRPFLVALIVLDPEGYARLAAGAGLDPDPEQATATPALEPLLLARIATRLQGFPGYAKIRRAAVVTRPWSIEEGLMTPTMKLKRTEILGHHQGLVDRLYEGHR